MLLLLLCYDLTCIIIIIIIIIPKVSLLFIKVNIKYYYLLNKYWKNGARKYLEPVYYY